MANIQDVTDSILSSIKKSLGIPVEVKDFDVPIIVEINAAFFVLTQLGVGPKKGFMISSEEDTYDEFVSDPIEQALIKQYLVDKTKISFDPPSSATLMESLKKHIDEAEFRLQVAWDQKKK